MPQSSIPEARNELNMDDLSTRLIYKSKGPPTRKYVYAYECVSKKI